MHIVQQPSSRRPRPRIAVGLIAAALVAPTVLADSQADAARPIEDPQTLRECIRRAGSAGGLASCEQRYLTFLRSRIEELSEAIEERLNGEDRRLFRQNRTAWAAFVDAERRLISMTLGRRPDRLGERLEPGLINQLYEQREAQLRGHLSNLRR